MRTIGRPTASMPVALNSPEAVQTLSLRGTLPKSQPHTFTCTATAFVGSSATDTTVTVTVRRISIGQTSEYHLIVDNLQFGATTGNARWQVDLGQFYSGPPTGVALNQQMWVYAYLTHPQAVAQPCLVQWTQLPGLTVRAPVYTSASNVPLLFNPYRLECRFVVLNDSRIDEQLVPYARVTPTSGMRAAFLQRLIERPPLTYPTVISRANCSEVRMGRTQVTENMTESTGHNLNPISIVAISSNAASTTGSAQFQRRRVHNEWQCRVLIEGLRTAAVLGPGLAEWTFQLPWNISGNTRGVLHPQYANARPISVVVNIVNGVATVQAHSGAYLNAFAAIAASGFHRLDLDFYGNGQ